MADQAELERAQNEYHAAVENAQAMLNNAGAAMHDAIRGFFGHAKKLATESPQSFETLGENLSSAPSVEVPVSSVSSTSAIPNDHVDTQTEATGSVQNAELTASPNAPDAETHSSEGSDADASMETVDVAIGSVGPNGLDQH